MEFISALPENSFSLSQEKLKLLCQTYYHNFTKEDLLEDLLDIGDLRVFKEILSDKHDRILRLNYVASPSILYRLVGLGVKVYAIENKSGNTGDNPSFSFLSIYEAFFLVISE